MTDAGVTVRPYEAPGDTTVVQRLASRLWPFGLHPGGTGWAGAIGQLADPIVIAEDGAGDPVGWAGIERGELILQVDPRFSRAAPALLDWAFEAAAGRSLTVGVSDADPSLAAAVTAAGFERGYQQGPSDHIMGLVEVLFLPAAERTPALPGGYRVRSVGAGEFDARVEVHRAAWRPADMPFPPGHPPADPEATSRFTGPLYEQVRATWLYDEALDLVVEAPDGSLAACCILWWDPATGVGEIEPLGVVPAHRRLGLAGALCH